MEQPQKIDFAKLLGFSSTTQQLSQAVDFQDETFGARLGAKVGKPEFDPVDEKS